MKLQDYYKGEGDDEAARNINQTDLLADSYGKTTILIEKKHCIDKRYSFYTRQLDRAHGGEARQAVEYRYIQGYSHEAMIVFFRRSLSDSTIS